MSGEPRAGEDTRNLPQASGGSRMRQDPLTGEWVPIASNRMDRTFLPSRAMCPLCPTVPGGPGTEIPAAGYDAVLFENRFPSLITRDEEPDRDSLPGAQLRLTDVDGHRLTAFATNARRTGPGSQLADLELRHRRRARCEDRIRNAKDIPAYATCPCTGPPPTRSGAKSSPSPRT